MNYQETLAYLMERLPMFSRLGAAAYKPNLDNTIALCTALGDPQKKIRSIHIAGTNGKGSVSHMLAAILQEAGYKVGLYTSPHLRDFRERIRINGLPCSEKFVVEFTAEWKNLIEEIKPSFFEITVAMAFRYFADNQVDVAVIETGLGGRLDSTNIIEPDLSVITSIGLDHIQLLGNTRESIAGEKAGIIKAHTPVVLGQMDSNLYKIFENKSLQVSGATGDNLVHIASNEWEILDLSPGEYLTIHVRERLSGAAEHVFQLDLPGWYQQLNLLTVLSSVRVLQQLGYAISFHQVKTALQQVILTTGLHGRWETIRTNPRVILEVAHNEDGMRQLSEQLNVMKFERLFIIIGMVKDKEINTVLSLLPQDASYFFSNASIPRALPANELMFFAKNYSLNGEVIPDVNIALEKALTQADKKDLIVICGSIFLVGEVDTVRFGQTNT